MKVFLVILLFSCIDAVVQFLFTFILLFVLLVPSYMLSNVENPVTQASILTLAASIASGVLSFIGYFIYHYVRDRHEIKRKLQEYPHAK